MPIADYFDEATLLDTFSWAGLPLETRIAKTAALYIKGEGGISRYHNNYQGPTAGVVKLFIKSLYTPQRGQLQRTVVAVLKEINRQKELREKRSKNRPYREPKPETRAFRSKYSIRQRRNRLARKRYTIWGKTYKGEPTKHDPDCIAVTRIAGNVMLVDAGCTYNRKPRVYLRNEATGKVKVVVLKGRKLESFEGALLRMAPKLGLRAMFEGKVITLDFEGEGFLVDGKTVPWRNVIKIYRGQKRAHQTKEDPSKT